jgi:cytochrome P450
MEARFMVPDSDFDHHSPEHAANPAASYERIRKRPGVAHTSAHGGYWVLTRYDDIASAGKDHEALSSALQLEESGEIRGGITLPHNPAATRMSLAEMDPPEWNHVRRALNPTLAPQAVEQFVPRIREVTTSFIDRFIETGSCDLVTDICSPIPAVVTLMYLGLPTDEWERFARPIHSSVYTPREPGHPEFEHLLAQFDWVFSTIRNQIALRRQSPGRDFISSLLACEMDGVPYDDELIFETVYTMLAAGVDTTTSLLSTAFLHLSTEADDRQRLIDDPSLLEAACEEFLRYYTPAQAGARTVRTKVSVGGTELLRGDRVLLAWASANRDGAVFPDPDRFVLDRSPNRHVAFGVGIHRCIGAHLARQEFKVIVTEVLRRLSDLSIDTERTPRYPDVGLMFGYQQMPATFTPASREGTTSALM